MQKKSKRSKEEEKLVKVAEEAKFNTITFFSKQDFSKKSDGEKKEGKFLELAEKNFEDMVAGTYPSKAAFLKLVIQATGTEKETMVKQLIDLNNCYYLLKLILNKNNLERYRFKEDMLTKEDKDFIASKVSTTTNKH